MRDGIPWEIRKADDVTAVVDVPSEVAHLPAEAAEVMRLSMPPEDCVGADRRTNRSADSRPPDNLTAIINRNGGSDWIARKRRQLLDFSTLRPPDDRFEVEHLPRSTVRILRTGFGSPDDLPQVVHSKDLTVIATQCGERGHHVAQQDVPAARVLGEH